MVAGNENHQIFGFGFFRGYVPECLQARLVLKDQYWGFKPSCLESGKRGGG